VIAKPFILAKDNYRISARILLDNQVIRDLGAFPAAFSERRLPMAPKRRGLPIFGLGAYPSAPSMA
jgi:hypothetical protein